jgi:hypothetical protein
MRKNRDGDAKRARLRETVLPGLQPGSFVPPTWWIAELLAVDARAARKHLRIVLQQENIEVSRGFGRDARRLYVRA